MTEPNRGARDGAGGERSVNRSGSGPGAAPPVGLPAPPAIGSTGRTAETGGVGRH
jgi:hypothetical protein